MAGGGGARTNVVKLLYSKAFDDNLIARLAGFWEIGRDCFMAFSKSTVRHSTILKPYCRHRTEYSRGTGEDQITEGYGLVAELLDFHRGCRLVLLSTLRRNKGLTTRRAKANENASCAALR
jgi:hypothetical protein